jgi:hypothetical protein
VIALVHLLVRLLTDLTVLAALSFRGRCASAAEILVLRRQLALYQERRTRPRRIDPVTRISLTILSRLFDWRGALVIVRPETMIRWHRARWKLFWRLKSRPGRPPIPQQLQVLISDSSAHSPSVRFRKVQNGMIEGWTFRSDSSRQLLRLPAAVLSEDLTPTGFGWGAPTPSFEVLSLRPVILLLQNSQFTPTCVLLSLSWVRVFVILQPESKPIDVTLLGCHSVERFLQDMQAIWNIDEVDWLLLLIQGCVNLPFRQHAGWVERFYAKGSLNSIQMKSGRTIDIFP